MGQIYDTRPDRQALPWWGQEMETRPMSLSACKDNQSGPGYNPFILPAAQLSYSLNGFMKSIQSNGRQAPHSQTGRPFLLTSGQTACR